MTRVITWQSPSGDTIDVTPDQERRLHAAGVWPRDCRGQEYCQVSHGLHRGEPSYTDDEIAELLRCEGPYYPCCHCDGSGVIEDEHHGDSECGYCGGTGEAQDE